MKDFLYWNNLHNQLRIATGVPQSVPVLPNINSTAQEILDFTTDTVFHVSNQTGSKESVHLFVSTPVAATIFVKVLSSNMIASNGPKTRIQSFPSTIDAVKFNIRANQPSPIPVLNGLVINNGAAIGLMSSVAGPKAFGFIVKN
jgi:hypothetical protein